MKLFEKVVYKYLLKVLESFFLKMFRYNVAKELNMFKISENI